MDPVLKCETKTPIKKGLVSRFIKLAQFPLILAWASIAYKVRGLSLEQGVIDFDLRKKKPFGTGTQRSQKLR